MTNASKKPATKKTEPKKDTIRKPAPKPKK